MTHSRNCILISSARSGTNLFLSLYEELFPNDIILGEIFRKTGGSLDKLPEILNASEEDILAKSRESPAQLWDELQAAASRTQRGLIAKIFYEHGRRHTEIWDKFKEGSKIIHLVRKNPFDAYVSLEVARQSDAWKSTSPNQEKVAGITLEIDPFAAEDFIEEISDCVKGVREFFKGADFHEIMYEDIAASPQTAIKQVADIFGVEPSLNKREFGLKKQNTIPHQDRIKNYDFVSYLDNSVF